MSKKLSQCINDPLKRDKDCGLYCGLPHSKTILGLNLPANWGFSVCSLHAHGFSLKAPFFIHSPQRRKFGQLATLKCPNM